VEYLDEPGPHGFFSRLARVGLLLEAFQARCFDPFGLRFIDYSVLRMLELEGDLSPTRLADLVVRSSGGMTQILDRLERGGLVARRPDPSDRRKVMVGLTPQGLRLVRRANRAWVAQKQELLAGVGRAEFTRLDEAVEDLLRRLDDGPDEEAVAAR
jgi:DNA-binding MarR family transcriptional regulator